MPEDVLPVSEKFYPTNKYKDFWKFSLDAGDQFWMTLANDLHWFKSPEKPLDWKHPFAKFFPGGLINASYNCLDRHMNSPRRNKAAFIWEGEPGEQRVVTYHDLYRETNKFAAVLKSLGVSKGDFVGIYLPLVPELPVAMLACARIGATFTVVFSGFGAPALADRFNDCKAKVVITADGGYRRGGVIQLKKIVDEAVSNCPTVKHVVVLKRAGNDIAMKNGRDVWWHDAMAGAAIYVEPEKLESTHPLYILYTSGTTGKPKGIVHGTGGYLAWVNATQKWVFDARDEDVFWCTADVGWVTGHSYVVFGPLLQGITSVMYEGAPDWPSPARWWSMIEKYGISILYTAPTALRAFMKFGNQFPDKHNLSSLRLLGTVGEPINPAAWEWYFHVIGKGRCPIVDTWWQTETGGILISVAPNLGLIPMKPGSATLPLPGIDAEVVDENGKPCETGKKGFLVIRKPWAGMFMTLYGDDERYNQVYWTKFTDVYYPGDYAVRDSDGYFWLLGRADEVLKVAGHRIGTIEIEDALISHKAVAESAVCGKPDAIKGEVIAACVVLKGGINPTPELKEELRKIVRSMVGAIAVPQDIYFVSKLPKTRSGKIMRRLIKAVVTKANLGDHSTIEDEGSIEEVKAAFAQLQEEVKS